MVFPDHIPEEAALSTAFNFLPQDSDVVQLFQKVDDLGVGDDDSFGLLVLEFLAASVFDPENGDYSF